MKKAPWWATACLLLSLLMPWAAQGAENLFTLSLRVSPEQMKAGEEALLASALRIELTRLTGVPDADSRVPRQLLAQPRRWIERYTFQPRRVEGVVVGQILTVTFSKSRLLAVLEQAGLVFWPPSARPRLLVTGWWNVYGTEKLITTALAQQPDLDLAYAAYLLGLRVRLPEQADPLLSRPVPDPDTLAALRQQYDVDAVLRIYFEEHYQHDKRRVDAVAEAFLSDQSTPRTAKVSGPTPADAFRAILDRFMDQWRTEYAATADSESLARIVLRLPTAEGVFNLEKQLERAAPVIRQVTLVRVDRDEAEFEVVYQGVWRSLAERLHQLKGFEIYRADVPAQRIELTEQVRQTERVDAPVAATD